MLSFLRSATTRLPKSSTGISTRLSSTSTASSEDFEDQQRAPASEGHNFLHPGNWLKNDRNAVLEMAHKFAKEKMYPNMREWDEKGELPLDVLKEAGELGFGGIYVPEECGGTGLNRRDASVIFEQLSQGCVSTAAYISIHNMVAWMISSKGSEELQSKFLPDLCSFEKLGSYCLTEPNHGSDAASIRTIAKKKGDYYIVNGGKAFISGAGTSDVYLVMMRLEGAPAGPKGIFCLALEKGMEGFTFGAKESKMGWNSQPTRAIYFDNVKVPAENVVAKAGEGFKLAMDGLNGGRVNIASCSLGAAQRSIDLAIEYVKNREQFGKKIAEFQHTEFKLAELAAKLYASRLMVRRAAEALDKNTADKVSLCAMAKLFATDNCYDVVHGSMQLFGGAGYLKDYPVEQYLRDVRVHQILEGTNEVMKMLLGRNLIQKDVFWPM